MEALQEQCSAIFENAGQAVHVAFAIMAQEATQDAPLRMALIRIMESIKLDTGNQRDWLDQLRGVPAGTMKAHITGFAGLTGGEVRAQCAMITQAVRTKLPAPERYAILAKCTQTEFEDIDLDDKQLPAVERPRGSRRRWAFSAEKADSIKGLSDYFQPMFPKLNSFAIDCMLGRLYADNKQVEISFRDLAQSFGGNAMQYQRATKKMKAHLRQLETMALDRLEPRFMRQGLTWYF